MANKTNSALEKPVTVGPDLVPVVGEGPMPRTAVTQKVWAYIKERDLQDPEDKRNIRADDNLKKVFGGKDTVSMFEMTKLISQHLS